MRKLFCILAVCLWAGSALSADAPAPGRNAAAPAKAPAPDSLQIEKDLQRLPWPQFRTVIEAIPKLKADVEAYGAFGWQYVKANYKTHGWKKNIDRLDTAQRQQLIELIRAAKSAR